MALTFLNRLLQPITSEHIPLGVFVMVDKVVVDEQNDGQAQLILELKLAKVERAFARKQISLETYHQQSSQLRRASHQEALAKAWIHLCEQPTFNGPSGRS
jgi:hypothetical protein